ncbi:hypothetical protein ACQP1K_22070 [Sphaerimonospora sp. CA-214678]|uniref:hypothetical protein n=1 Tax=Sphaerimonospora sp. CA-214678 TaxID=3240029 RepID=UPI003D91DDB5
MTIERETGLTFPPDYKEVVGRYAQLVIDRNLGLWIYHPGIYPNVSERDSALVVLNSLRSLSGSIDLISESGDVVEVPEMSHYPQTGGLYPWATTQNGDFCLWITHPDPTRWSVVVTDGTEWWKYPGSMLDFLVGALDGTVWCPIFGGGLSVEKQEFAREDLDRR